MAEGKVTVLTILPEKFNLHLENYKKPNLLYCYNGGYFLRVLPNGAVDGIRDRSDKHTQKYQDRNWYLGIKKNGSCKSGEKTHIGQKAILFLPLSASSD
ncbi:Fibroblast growth factor 1 [Acipenser ruthenus]|uniref:Fibroblast growth factor 1 n=1 Tax=Acipenser ruthenus TaxID=7906 RepID=A0A444V4N6_ACIRT|nr:Fibroblast growth factor 1 [Acipenser ruthenus]